jgi:hypothetical protein
MNENRTTNNLVLQIYIGWLCVVGHDESPPTDVINYVIGAIGNNVIGSVVDLVVEERLRKDYHSFYKCYIL